MGCCRNDIWRNCLSGTKTVRSGRKTATVHGDHGTSKSTALSGIPGIPGIPEFQFLGYLGDHIKYHISVYLGVFNGFQGPSLGYTKTVYTPYTSPIASIFQPSHDRLTLLVRAQVADRVQRLRVAEPMNRWTWEPEDWSNWTWERLLFFGAHGHKSWTLCYMHVYIYIYIYYYYYHYYYYIYERCIYVYYLCVLHTIQNIHSKLARLQHSLTSTSFSAAMLGLGNHWDCGTIWHNLTMFKVDFSIQISMWIDS